jgi:hypothetical protein
MPYVTLKAAEMKFLQSIKKQVRRDIIWNQDIKQNITAEKQQ